MAGFDLESLPRPRQPGQELTFDEAKSLIEDFWRSLSPVSISGYRSDLKRFSRFVGMDAGLDLRKRDDLSRAISLALKALCSRGPGAANALALRWRESLFDEKKLSPANVNRHMSALRSLVAFARTLGLVEWTLAIRGVRAQAYRDTRGPTQRSVELLLDAAEAQGGRVGARDAALVRLLFDMALRRGEVVGPRGLDIKHVEIANPDDAGAWVLGKGKRERVRVPMARPTAIGVRTWLDKHPRGKQQESPLFLGLGGPNKGKRLSGRQVANVLKKLSKLAGLPLVRPHGLRHSAITAALDATKGDVRSVQAFSRHARLDTVMIYDDTRRETGKRVAAQVALGATGARVAFPSPCCGAASRPSYLGKRKSRALRCTKCGKEWSPDEQAS